MRAVIAAALSAALMLGAIAARAETVEQLYRQAKSEGGLALYSAGPTAPWERWTKEFEARYPGVPVTITGGFSNVLNAQIDHQIAARRLEVDLAVFQTLQDFVRWKKQGALLPFKPAGFDKIDRSFKDRDGAYIGIAVNAHPYAYDSEHVVAADVPKSALDFLKPQFRGKVVAAYPADDDATLYVFYSIVKKYGWSYMDRYTANQPSYIQGHLGVERAVAAGDSWLTFDTVLSIHLDQKPAGGHAEIAISPVDRLPVWPRTAAIFKGAPHPNAAKLFLTWYLMKEQQRRLNTWSVRSDVPPPAGLKPIFAYRIVNNYRDFVSNDRLVAALRKRFESYSGPVVNQGGVK